MGELVSGSTQRAAVKTLYHVNWYSARDAILSYLTSSKCKITVFQLYLKKGSLNVQSMKFRDFGDTAGLWVDPVTSSSISPNFEPHVFSIQILQNSTRGL
jgi:hypothetical protein